MRLIDTDALPLERYGEEVISWYATGWNDAIDAINRAPAVDAEPVRHGKWRHLGGDEWCCTVCGEVIYTEGSWEKPTRKYCHECGAKMDKGVQNDQN